eukprot:5044587-Ditylum_brightwellii.AAC.1
MPSSPQPVVNLDNFPSIIEIVKGSIPYNISDMSQDVDSGSILQSMSGAARHAKLDKNNIRHSRSFAVHSCYYRLSNRYLNTTQTGVESN